MQGSDGIACLTRYMGRVADLNARIATLWFTATCSHAHPYLEHDRILLANLGTSFQCAKYRVLSGYD
jgi:hypothetical protein